MVKEMNAFADSRGQSSQLPPPSPSTGYSAEKPAQQQQDTATLKGNCCAVYDMTGPRGYKFKLIKQPTKKPKENNKDINELANKLNEIILDNEKHAVAKLNEIMIALKKSVVYEMVDIGGFVHSPIFTVRVKNEEMSAFGTGTTKKEAKRQAAIAFMKNLDIKTGSNDISSTTSNNITTSIDENFSKEGLVDLKSEINPIGLLQETCMNYHWQLPTYEYLKADNTDSRENSGFVAYCVLYMYKTSGVSRTKQSAKKEAARLMYEQIKKLSSDEINNLSLHVYPPSIVMLQNNSPDKNPNETDMLNTVNTLKSVEEFYAKLKASKNPTINNLKNLNLTIVPGNAVEILDQIGEEEGFTSKYVLLSDSVSNQAGVLVQVSVTPLIVHVAVGKTTAEAQESAANVALIYLKLFLE